MAVTDSISDLLSRIRNGGQAGHRTVEIPRSNLKVAIVQILKDQGYITDFEDINEGVQGSIKVVMRYHNRQPAIREIKRASKPGRRLYVSTDTLPRVKNGLGVAIISTPKGVMTDKDARRMNVGGEFLCTVW